jgi:hypothetical protein
MFTWKTPAAFTNVCAVRVKRAGSRGNVPLFEWKNTLKLAAGPVPLKYTPVASTSVIVQVCPAGTTKSSAKKSSNALFAVSKSCEFVLIVPGLLFWS